MWVIMSKQVYYKNENFQIWYELENGELIAHISVNNASKSTMEDALKMWTKFKAQAYFEGFERIIAYTRDERIFKWFPFAHREGEFELRGRTYGVWQWELN